MSKYIADSYLYRAIGADINGGCGKCVQSRSDCMCQSLSRMDICGIIEDAPTADVAEVKHGRWHKNGNCSNCGKYYGGLFIMKPSWNYCPNCGASMEGIDE